MSTPKEDFHFNIPNISTLTQRLYELYPDQEASLALERIQAMIQEYKNRIVSVPYHLSEKDSILITYGDQVQQEGENPLQVLNRFCDEFLGNLVSAVHILPFYPWSSDDGFSVIDYVKVDSDLGVWDDIYQLSKHYRLMFDGVINHMSQHSDWFQSYLNDDPEFEDFFLDMDPELDLSDVVRPRTSPLLSEFVDSKGKTRHIWTTFSRDQVDLNYSNYRVLLAVLDVLLTYVEKGASLIRLDAIAFIWKQVGTTCVHRPQTHNLIQLIRDVIHDVAPEVILITETNVPHKENISYFGSGDNEAQMVYNFALPPLLAHSILRGTTMALSGWARSLELPSNQVCFFNFTASHDGVGLRPVQELLDEDEIYFLCETAEEHGGKISYRAMSDGSSSPYEINCNYMDLLSHPEDSDELREKRMILSQAVVLAMPGVPGIYFHSLTGSQNDFEGMKKTGVHRSINREKLNYETLAVELKDEKTIRGRLYKDYAKLLSIRKNEQAFNPYARFDFPRLNPHIFAIQRFEPDSETVLLALFNFSERRQKFFLKESIQLPAIDLISQQKIDEDRISMEPYQILWLKCFDAV